MRASKENAKKAAELFDKLNAGKLKNKKQEEAAREFISGFLEAARRKLPSDAAYEKDKQRRKKKAA